MRYLNYIRKVTKDFFEIRYRFLPNRYTSLSGVRTPISRNIEGVIPVACLNLVLRCGTDENPVT